MCNNKVKTIKKNNKVKFVNIFLMISLPRLPLTQVRNSHVDTWCPKGRY